MLKYKPETDKDVSEGLPKPEPGTHTMKLQGRRMVESVSACVVLFRDIDNKTEGEFWINAPDEARGKKGTLWKLKNLAKALGEDAVTMYHKKDDNGDGMFDPMDFVGRWCRVTVSQFGVDRVEPADPEVVKNLEAKAKGTKGKAAKVAADDIPF